MTSFVFQRSLAYSSTRTIKHTAWLGRWNIFCESSTMRQIIYQPIRSVHQSPLVLRFPPRRFQSCSLHFPVRCSSLFVRHLRFFTVTANDSIIIIHHPGACQGRRCRCHESPPCRSVLRASLCRRQAKIQRTQVGLHCSEPRLSGTARPSSPICRSVRNAGLQSSVVVLAWICSDEVVNARK